MVACYRTRRCRFSPASCWILKQVRRDAFSSSVRQVSAETCDAESAVVLSLSLARSDPRPPECREVETKQPGIGSKCPTVLSWHRGVSTLLLTRTRVEHGVWLPPSRLLAVAEKRLVAQFGCDQAREARSILVAVRFGDCPEIRTCGQIPRGLVR